MPRGLIVCMPFENHVPGRVSLEEGTGNHRDRDFRRCIFAGDWNDFGWEWICRVISILRRGFFCKIVNRIVVFVVIRCFFLWILPKKLGIGCKFIFTMYNWESLRRDNFEWWMVMWRNFIGESVMNGAFCISSIGD